MKLLLKFMRLQSAEEASIKIFVPNKHTYSNLNLQKLLKCKKKISTTTCVTSITVRIEIFLRKGSWHNGYLSNVKNPSEMHRCHIRSGLKKSNYKIVGCWC